jgi:hypothetical protein
MDTNHDDSSGFPTSPSKKSDRPITARVTENTGLRTTLGTLAWYTAMVAALIGTYLRMEYKLDMVAGAVDGVKADVKEEVHNIRHDLSVVHDALVYNHLFSHDNGSASRSADPLPGIPGR